MFFTAVMQPWYRQQIVYLITLCKETTIGTPTGELLLGKHHAATTRNGHLWVFDFSIFADDGALPDSGMAEGSASFPPSLSYYT
jgi:hypothetical protein